MNPLTLFSAKRIGRDVAPIVKRKRREIEETCDGAIRFKVHGVKLNDIVSRIKALGIDYESSKSYIRFWDGNAEIMIFNTGKVLIKGANEETGKEIRIKYFGE